MSPLFSMVSLYPPLKDFLVKENGKWGPCHDIASPTDEEAVEDVVDANGDVTLYITNDERMNAEVARLYGKLRRGESLAQRHIDQYLLIPWVNFDTRFPLEFFKIPVHMTPCFDLLPDIIPAIDKALSMGFDVHTVYFLSFIRQCIPLKKRSKRMSKDVNWQREDKEHMQTLVRCSLGSLLGLYPDTCKSTNFLHRSVSYMVTRSVLVSSYEEILDFFKKNLYIIRLSTMEHCCNLIKHFFPSIYSFLSSRNNFDGFVNSVSVLCDSFRSDFNAFEIDSVEHFKDDVMPKLNHLAQMYFERCFRTHRTSMVAPSNIRDLFKMDNKKNHGIKLEIQAQSSQFFQKIQELYFSPSSYVFSQINRGRCDNHVLELAWRIFNNVCVSELPLQITLNQMMGLERNLGNDQVIKQKKCCINVCLNCALLQNFCWSPMANRFDWISGRYICISCEKQSVIEINILGRILSIGREKVYFSSCCSKALIWTGTGCEWNKECGEHCRFVFQGKAGRKNWEKKTVNKKRGLYTCSLCTSKSIVATKSLLNVNSHMYRNYHFCGKHVPSRFILEHIKTSDDLLRYQEELPNLKKK